MGGVGAIGVEGEEDGSATGVADAKGKGEGQGDEGEVLEDRFRGMEGDDIVGEEVTELELEFDAQLLNKFLNLVVDIFFALQNCSNCWSTSLFENIAKILEILEAEVRSFHATKFLLSE